VANEIPLAVAVVSRSLPPQQTVHFLGQMTDEWLSNVKARDMFLSKIYGKHFSSHPINFVAQRLVGHHIRAAVVTPSSPPIAVRARC
jgi:hypothetical protein